MCWFLQKITRNCVFWKVLRHSRNFFLECAIVRVVGLVFCLVFRNVWRYIPDVNKVWLSDLNWGLWNFSTLHHYGRRRDNYSIIHSPCHICHSFRIDRSHRWQRRGERPWEPTWCHFEKTADRTDRPKRTFYDPLSVLTLKAGFSPCFPLYRPLSWKIHHQSVRAGSVSDRKTQKPNKQSTLPYFRQLSQPLRFSF